MYEYFSLARFLTLFSFSVFKIHDYVTTYVVSVTVADKNGYLCEN